MGNGLDWLIPRVELPEAPLDKQRPLIELRQPDKIRFFGANSGGLGSLVRDIVASTPLSNTKPPKVGFLNFETAHQGYNDASNLENRFVKLHLTSLGSHFACFRDVSVSVL